MNPIFLPAPDETDTALREELFTAQVTGLRQYPQTPQSLREKTLTVCEAPSITEAVQRLKVIYLLGDWPFGHHVRWERRNVSSLTVRFNSPWAPPSAELMGGLSLVAWSSRENSDIKIGLRQSSEADYGLS
ncbi:hypothetical protein Xbud_01713 [Xenorhabdus budapestensis]|uniref:YubB ferredoxin-like domain-containing protein n=1 Tax=Xenorhabdus budapestensis TaxID=290110 RepID=A0A2D0J216_XENBU|nr:hypothetical protein Xbud_01713 [Xenorhabdus budapestensis]